MVVSSLVRASRMRGGWNVVEKRYPGKEKKIRDRVVDDGLFHFEDAMAGTLERSDTQFILDLTRDDMYSE